VKPAGANPIVAWTSSNTAIATVNPTTGIVHAVAAGKATITAKTINGYSATCAVTVTVPVEEIIIDPATCTIPLKGAKVLKATVYPADATNKTLTWTSSDPTIATVNTSGTVTAKSINGDVTITATNTASGISGTCIVTVGTGKIANADDVETQLIASVQIYPNPTDGQLTISLPNPSEGGAYEAWSIEIYDAVGRSVNIAHPTLRILPSFGGGGGGRLGGLDISHLPAGIYFIRITTENGIVTRKVVKQ
jgi:hypothetical protein